MRGTFLRASSASGTVIVSRHPEISIRLMRQHNQPTPRILHDENDLFEVDAIVNRRLRGTKYQYLVKYSGYGPEHNQWIPEIQIADSCRDLIEQYDRAHPRE